MSDAHTGPRTRPATIVAMALAIAPLLLLVLGGIGKALAPYGAGLGVLTTFGIEGLPRAVTESVALTLGAIELSAVIVAVTLLRARRPTALIGPIALYAVLTCGYIVGAMIAGAPEPCPCFGAFEAHLADARWVREVLTRNIACLIALSIATLALRASWPGAPLTPSAPVPPEGALA